jgi:hypothetical protein
VRWSNVRVFSFSSAGKRSSGCVSILLG